MIIFVYQSHHAYTHKDIIQHPDLCATGGCNYHWLLNCKQIPPATYIFIDRERMDLTELRVYADLFRYINNLGNGYRAINDPAVMMNRRSLLRALYMSGVNDFNAYPVTEREIPKRFPVFVRREYDHAKPLTDLLYSADELQRELGLLHKNGEPEDGLLVVEYCAEPVAGTLFRKLSAYRIGESVLFYNTVHEENWLVKYGTLNAATDAMYQEEQDMVLSNAFELTLRQAFEVAGIEYGRADFGIVKGRVQVYEINTNPTTKPPKEHPNPIRTETQRLAWQRYCDAIKLLDNDATVAPQANNFSHPNLRKKEKGMYVYRS